MSTKTLTFALFGNLYQREKSAAIQEVLACLKVHGARVVIDEEYYHFINEMCNVHRILDAEKDRFTTFVGDDFEADFAISMGGDGTFLKTACRVGGYPETGYCRYDIYPYQYQWRVSHNVSGRRTDCLYANRFYGLFLV